MPTSRPALRRTLAALVVAASLGACGSTAPPSAEPGTTTRSGGSTPGTAPKTAIAACADVEPLGPIRTSDQPSMATPPMEMMNAVAGYTGRHRDTFAGSWIDRDHGGTYVFAFTDDPANHRGAIAAYRSQPGDDVAVVTAAPPPGASTTTTAAPPGTTLGESGWPFDVVQARFTEAELRALQQRLPGELQRAGVRVESLGVATQQNRVRISLLAADEAARAAIADLAPVDQVCVDLPVPRPGRPQVTSVLPTDPDPWVTCDGIVVRRSAANSATPLAADDPLLVAIRRDLAQQPGMEGGGGDWFVVARSETEASARRASPAATVQLQRRGDRWSVVGTGSGGAGRGCDGRVLFPDGLGPVEVALDPAFPPPGRADATVHLLVSEMRCSGGRDLRPHLVGPELREEDGRLLVGYAARAPEGSAQTCQGRAPDPVTLMLPAPLGDRALLDGTFVPPKPIETGARMGLMG